MRFFRGIKLKPLDGVLLVILMLLSFVPVLTFAKTTDTATSVVVKAHGKVVKTMSLADNQTWTYNDGSDYNVIQVKNRAVRVTEANCYNQIDVNAGWISQAGQSLVCLPHSLTITLTGTGKLQQDGKVVDYQ
ncbi:MAG: NusG domain II-containing protein [Streptococcaceae bacterium]|jgi:hypothetical protein|nr:NusG domain II-containing protein [Streptococcaceae bacterium]